VKCLTCQFENPADVRFCVECGARLESICPRCGSRSVPSFKFCGKCGYDLRASKAPPVDYSEPQTYTPKFLADKILSTGKSLEGERKLVTVLFADVANYTTMSEKLDPEEVHQIMDGCLQILMDEIHRYEGTVDKFTGDGIMALFGAPLAHEDHAQRACYAALGIQRALGPYADKVKEESKVDFRMRVGLNSGPVMVGTVGNDLRMDYTALGDTVNLASRMQSMAHPGTSLVSGETYRLARDFFVFKPLGPVTVKGKAEAIEVWELVDIGQATTRLQAAAAKGLTRFVGRDQEMALLKEAFEEARLGSGQVVGIVGEAGVGKSRLLLELRRALSDHGHTYLEGHCLHYGGSMPYLPFLDILRAYFEIKDGDQESLIKEKTTRKIGVPGKRLEDSLPPLGDILSLKVDDEAYLKLEPQKKRERIFESIRDLLIAESQSRPVIVAIEDLHWMDKTSEEFLNYFIGFLANARILVILLYRPEYTHRWGSKSCYSQIRVDQLPLATSAELVRSILEEGDVAPDLRELILNRAAGNPLFMEEFTHTLLENGSIGKIDHQYVLTRKASEIAVPDTIQGIIAARMDRLDENLKRTMQVASVIGRDFAFRILQTITGMKEDLKSYLVNLQGLEFIYEKSLFPELEYVFKHALTQEVAYNSLLIKRRKEIHERIGRAIEELYTDRLEEFYEMLAHHYSMAESWEKAYHHLRLSAEKAGISYSTVEAFRLYREAISALNKLPNSYENKRRGIDLRLRMASPMQALGYPEDSLEILQEGARISEELGDDRSLSKLFSLVGLRHVLKGNGPEGLKYAQEAFDRAERVEDVDLMAPIGGDLSSSYNVVGESLKTVAVAPRLTRLLEKTHRESEFFGREYNIYSWVLANQGRAVSTMGGFEEGEILCKKALRFAEGIGNPFNTGWARLMLGWVYDAKGDGRNAVHHALEAVKCFEDSQFLLLLGAAYSALGWGHLLLGEPDASRSCADRAVEIDRRFGVSFYLSLAHWLLGLIDLQSGDSRNAQACIERSLVLSQDNNEKWIKGLSMIWLGKCLQRLDLSQSEAAERSVLQGIETLNALRSRPFASTGYLLLGELYADSGRRREALDALGRAQGAFKEMGMDYWLARTEKALEGLKE
jgi:class 3 adenylate cyclase/tetratricopeptide (TPR) repeat protein